MTTLILGCHGSMGKRYQAILKFLNQPFVGIDQEHSELELNQAIDSCERIIVATPTDTHTGIMNGLIPQGKPILCEKPVTKNLSELHDLFQKIKDFKTPFRMMLQYQMLTNPYSHGDSHYNYFRHGSDGLIWDCMQIIGLAQGEVILREQSPIWMCKINGRYLQLSEMDYAYIDYVRLWFNQPSQDLEEIAEIHQKTHDYLREFHV